MNCKNCNKKHENNNTGCLNSGYYNSGYYNSGDYNSGYRNSGNYNSGDYNSGDRNSGDRNSGYCNSGYRNSGNYNSGNRNSGNYNSGHYNSGDYNSGWFNTNEPKMRFFNKDSDMTYSEFIEKGLVCPDLKICSWVELNDLPKEEQTESAKQMGGLLKTLSYKEVAKLAGSPKAARAVGNILSKNNNWPNVPCHRVIRSDGKIGNWKWGKTKKALLLQQEGFLVFKNKSPKNY